MGGREDLGAVHDPMLRECIRRMNRQALHAHRLAFRHPQTGERVEFESPISQEYERAY